MPKPEQCEGIVTMNRAVEEFTVEHWAGARLVNSGVSVIVGVQSQPGAGPGDRLAGICPAGVPLAWGAGRR